MIEQAISIGVRMTAAILSRFGSDLDRLITQGVMLDHAIQKTVIGEVTDLLDGTEKVIKTIV